MRCVNSLLALTLLAGCATHALALPSDSSQPIRSNTPKLQPWARNPRDADGASIRLLGRAVAAEGGGGEAE